MNFLNLSPAEVFVLIGSVSAIVTTLYLLERSRKRRVVSTLRFWTENGAARYQKSRRRVQEPWSLLLQLLALACLCLAIAQVNWSGAARRVRNHVLLLDTSSASALPEEKSSAAEYLARVPSTDRVMLVEVNGLVTPKTPFTTDQTELRRKLGDAKPSSTALNLQHALEFAEQALTWPKGDPGEIVYDGPGRVMQPVKEQISSLRILPVNSAQQRVSITSVRAQPGSSPDQWTAVVAIKNYGSEPKQETLSVQFGASPFAPRLLRLASGEERHAEYSFVTNTGGELRVSLRPDTDSTAVITLPPNHPLRVVAYTGRPESMRPLFGANRHWSVEYLSPARYQPAAKADLVVLDKFSPRVAPNRPALYVDPPAQNSPLPLKSILRNQVVTGWNGEGLHALDVHLPESTVYQTFEGDSVIASVPSGPVVVSRTEPNGLRTAVIGFDLATGPLRYNVTSPLLIAHLLRWLAPESFDVPDVFCRTVGLVDIPLQNAEHASVRVTDAAGRSVPFTARGGRLEFYAEKPMTVRVAVKGREQTISLALPQIAAYEWKPNYARMGVPPRGEFVAAQASPWRILAIAGGLLLLAEWLLFARRPSRARTLLKFAGLACVAAAFFVPAVRMPTTRTGTVVLVDTSDSIGSEATSRASTIVRKLAQERRGNWLRVVPFDASPKPLSNVTATFVAVSNKADEQATDLEAALIQSIAAVPEGLSPRVLLLSDGNENQGSAVRAIAELRKAHMPVNTIPLTGRSLTKVTVSAVTIPARAYSGESIPITATIDSPSATHGLISLQAEHKLIGTQPIVLEKGTNTVRLQVRVRSTGTTMISGTVSAGPLGTAEFQQPIALQRARVLYISQDPRGTDSNLLDLLRSDQFTVDTGSNLPQSPLRDWQLLILNNVDLNTVSAQQKQGVEQYVTQGGGLLLIGGEHQVYKDVQQADALDRVLPARLAPPRNPEGISVVLIIDKSSSMEGRKIELARLSAIGVVDHLRDQDTIGVLMFDNSYSWAVPMRKAVDKKAIKRMIAGIMPDGGTQIAPALAEAYRKVIKTPSLYKHIVLLTDGISEEGDSLDLAREAEAHEVTISTVGLGQDVNRPYLEKVASLANGRSYFLSNPQGLEQILLKDVQDYTGSTAVEKPLVPSVAQKAEILDGIDFSHAPPLKGYVRFEAKPDAQTVLTIEPEKHDPLYVRWQYGLGRVAVFTSDAKSRWAERWVTWPGYNKLWTNIARDLVSAGSGTEATAAYDSADKSMKVRYRLSPGVADPAKAPDLFVIGPNGFAERLELRRTATGEWDAEMHKELPFGVYRIRPMQESRLFPELAFYRTNEELRVHGVNEFLLRELARFTGGQYNVSPERTFDANGEVAYTRAELWPGVLSLALALTLAELVLRKWRALVELVRR